MVLYSNDGDVAEIDGYKFRRDKHSGYYLSAKPIKNGKRMRLHVYVWEKTHGEVPKGWHVHHEDGNKRNNEPNNLKAMPGRQHELIHGSQLTAEERAKLRDRINAIRDKASEWHKSEAGREWHKKHYYAMDGLHKLHPEHVENCANCGEPVLVNVVKPRYFCCNSCKSAYRRKSGVDDVIRVCTVCGEKFKVNKYAKKRTCSRKCAARLRIKNKAVQNQMREA